MSLVNYALARRKEARPISEEARLHHRRNEISRQQPPP